MKFLYSVHDYIAISRLISEFIKISICLAILLTISGCQILGPKALRTGRPNYDFALQETNNQSMLLNIIRLRYNDSPSFLEVTNIYSAPVIQGSVNFDASDIAKTDIYGGSTGFIYSETPVIMYSPLTGNKFAKHILTPISLNTIALLINGGWSQDLVFRICIQSINGISNAENAAGPTPERAPTYEVFKRVSKTLDRLEKDKHLTISYSDTARNEKLSEINIYIDESVRNRPDVQQLFEDLRLNPFAPFYTLKNSSNYEGNSTIAIITRPLMGIMFFISQGVQVPEQDIYKKVVTVTKNSGGDFFKWENVINDIMNIKSSVDKPNEAYIAVRYRNYWFYISDNDVYSKQTLFLLHTLFTLQAGELPLRQEPLLTLPVR